MIRRPPWTWVVNLAEVRGSLGDHEADDLAAVASLQFHKVYPLREPLELEGPALNAVHRNVALQSACGIPEKQPGVAS